MPARGGFLLAANHFSFADPVILGSMLPRRLWFVMAEDQFEKPLLKSFSRLMDVIPVQAGAAFRLGPIRKCLSVLKAGRVVAIFPEGRRSSEGHPPAPHAGGGRPRFAGARSRGPRGHRRDEGGLPTGARLPTAGQR